MFSHEEIKFNYKKEVVKALIIAERVKLAWRPYNVKFDESQAVFLAHKNNLHGFEIGNVINFRKLPLWITGDKGQAIWDIKDPAYELYTGGFINRCAIAGFFKMQGYIVGSEGIKMEDYFCALYCKDKIPKEFCIGNEYYLPPSILRAGLKPKNSVLLFWVEGLHSVIE